MAEKRICSICGANNPIVIRSESTIGKHRSWIEWGDKDGVSKEEACLRAYNALWWIAEQRHYKTKWIEFKFLKIFGFYAQYATAPEPPRAALMYWLHRENEAFKRRKREEELTNRPVIAKIPHPVDYVPSWMTDEDWAVKL